MFNPDLLLKLLSLNSFLLKVVSSQVISVNLQPLKLFISYPIKVKGQENSIVRISSKHGIWCSHAQEDSRDTQVWSRAKK